jgi:hypothetical protein
MKQKIILELESGKKIELTKEEFEELKSEFSEVKYISVPDYQPNPVCPTSPWYNTPVTRDYVYTWFSDNTLD